MKQFNTFNDISLLDVIPQKHISRITYLIHQIKNNRLSLDNPEWENLIQLLCQDILSDFNIARKQLTRLTRLVNISFSELPAVILMIKAVTDNSFLFYGNILHLYEGMNFSLSNPLSLKRTKEVFQSLFLIEINIRLQILYRLFLNTFFPNNELFSHDQKVESLGGMESTAYNLIAALNLKKFFSWLKIDDLEDKSKFLNRLSFFAFQVKVVNFRFTYHCNISCRHCYNSSSPSNILPHIEQSKMIQIIREMPEFQVDHLNITGGEPFLYPHIVYSLIKEARRQKINRVSIYTNGFWASTLEEGRKQFINLKNAGFMSNPDFVKDQIKVSAGFFHQEFLPIANLLNIVQLYFEIFKKPLLIDYELFENSLDEKKNFLAILKQRNMLKKTKLIFRNKLIPVGRGTALTIKNNYRDIEEFSFCNKIIEITIDPDGSVRPCCGINSTNSGLVLGTIQRNNLLSLIKKMQNNPILQFLSTNPLGKVFDYLDFTPKPEGYLDKCSLCLDSIGNIKDSEHLKKKLSPLQEYFPFRFFLEKYLEDYS